MAASDALKIAPHLKILIKIKKKLSFRLFYPFYKQVTMNVINFHSEHYREEGREFEVAENVRYGSN